MTTTLRARRTLLGHPPCEGALLIIFTSKSIQKDTRLSGFNNYVIYSRYLVRFFWTSKKQDGTASGIQIFHRAGAAAYEIKGLGSEITVYSDAQYYEPYSI